jgi:hypothetical protein
MNYKNKLNDTISFLLSVASFSDDRLSRPKGLIIIVSILK